MLEDVGSGALGDSAISLDVDALDGAVVDDQGGPLVALAGSKHRDKIKLKVQGLGELGLRIGEEADLKENNNEFFKSWEFKKIIINNMSFQITAIFLRLHRFERKKILERKRKEERKRKKNSKIHKNQIPIAF